MGVKINGRKANIKKERQLAVEMWEFVRVCQTDLCTGYDSMSLKRKFCNMKHILGIDIDWEGDCFLCNYAGSCLDCPLYKIAGDKECSHYNSPYNITMCPDDYQYYQVDDAIDKIIKAIESLDI